MTLTPIVYFALAYLIGSIPTGYWLGKAWKGVDVRQHGSGNLGATNVFRVLGPLPGSITLAIDILKGYLVVFVANILFPGVLWALISSGVFAIVGHTMSIFVRFRGGKGVATSAGVFLALLPGPSLVALFTFLVVFGISRYVSLGSLSGALALVTSAFFFSAPQALTGTATVVAFFVCWTHRSNIKRLLAGTENRIEWKKT
jgi:acyl phosphate:glycerol-3-phosphate acyltransferase